MTENEKQFFLIQGLLLFGFMSCLWLLDISVTMLGIGELRTFLFTFNPLDSYHIALCGLMFVYFVNFTYILYKRN